MSLRYPFYVPNDDGRGDVWTREACDLMIRQEVVLTKDADWTLAGRLGKGRVVGAAPAPDGGLYFTVEVIPRAGDVERIRQAWGPPNGLRVRAGIGYQVNRADRTDPSDGSEPCRYLNEVLLREVYKAHEPAIAVEADLRPGFRREWDDVLLASVLRKFITDAGSNYVHLNVDLVLDGRAEGLTDAEQDAVRRVLT